MDDVIFMQVFDSLQQLIGNLPDILLLESIIRVRVLPFHDLILNRVEIT